MEIYAYAVAVLLWLSMIAYAVLGGADFGGGIWNVLFFGRKGEGARALIRGAVGPVWEANNVWLIFVVVGLYAGFPIVAASLANALFIPLTLILIGIVFRGASFAFRTHFSGVIEVRIAWGTVFGVASLFTPFVLGACAAAVASGQIAVRNGQAPIDLWQVWLTPFAITIGFTALALCATIAATFLAAEAERINNAELMNAFRLRAFLAGGLMATTGIGGTAAFFCRGSGFLARAAESWMVGHGDYHADWWSQQPWLCGCGVTGWLAY